MPRRVPYCPKNGCGMPNGAAMPHPVTCKHCGNTAAPLRLSATTEPYSPLTNHHKSCPRCHRCIGCGRVIKREYNKEA
jgi:DNA-directed RNA polymerase subunit N (RpoN/RPB10)